MKKIILFILLSYSIIIHGYSTLKNDSIEKPLIKALTKVCYELKEQNGVEIKGDKCVLPNSQVSDTYLNKYFYNKENQNQGGEYSQFLYSNGEFWNIDYNDSGKTKKEVRYNSNGEISYYLEYRYDTLGRQKEIVSFDGKSKIVLWKDVYKYEDETGIKKDYSILHFNERAYMTTMKVYKYNNDGLVTAFFDFNYMNGNCFLMNYEYNDRNQRISQNKYSITPASFYSELIIGGSVEVTLDANDLMESRTYEYNDKGQRQKEVYINELLLHKTTKQAGTIIKPEDCGIETVWIYDERNNLYSQTSYLIKCNSGELELAKNIFWLYDDKDNLLVENIYYYDSNMQLESSTEHRFIYKYDEFGYILEMKAYEDKQPLYIVDYIYEYW